MRIKQASEAIEIMSKNVHRILISARNPAFKKFTINLAIPCPVLTVSEQTHNTGDEGTPWNA